MIEIVRAEEPHIASIDKLWLEFMHFHQDIDPIFTPRYGAVPSFEEDMIRRFMKSEDGLVLVALEQGQVVGYSVSEIHGPMKGYKLDKFGLIEHVAVTSGYRHRGIGEKMLSEILKWFQSRNVDRIEVEGTVKNQVAYSFWKKHGFADYKHTLYRDV